MRKKKAHPLLQWLLSAVIACVLLGACMQLFPIPELPPVVVVEAPAEPTPSSPGSILEPYALSEEDKAIITREITACNATLFSMGYVDGSTGSAAATAIMTFLESEGYSQTQAGIYTYEQIPRGGYLACENGIFTIILGDL